MKTLALLLGIFMSTVTTNLLAQEGVTVRVTIENVLNDSGTILGALHSPDTFMRGNGLHNATVAAQVGEVTLTFTNVAPGTYAGMFMHDKNDNQQMDREANGMPMEDWGTTGEMNPYGPPTFEGAKFEVGDKDMDVIIRF
jgi:uncharacterized protein (DUF2141 family)